MMPIKGQVREDLCANANLDLLVDVSYGVLWYRLLAAGGPGAAGPASASRPDEGG
jgi:hypothetical protein